MWHPDGLLHGFLMVGTGLAFLILAPTLRQHALPSILQFVNEWQVTRQRGPGWWLEILYNFTGLLLVTFPLTWCAQAHANDAFGSTLRTVTSVVWLLCLWFAHRAGCMRWNSPEAQKRVYLIRFAIWATGAFLLTQLIYLNHLARGLIPPL